MTIIVLMLLFLVGKDKYEELVDFFINLSAYREFKCLDLLVAHYGGVATVGLVVSLLTYKINSLSFLPHCMVLTIVFILWFVIICAYVLLLFRMFGEFYRRVKHKHAYIIVAIFVFVVDMTAISFFYDAARSVSS
ncbi:MAG: hypothetical protein Q4F13_15305 [Pseudomonadota bacterium]|nr:hypothetical protein [Pseudomonadota bacterium]